MGSKGWGLLVPQACSGSPFGSECISVWSFVKAHGCHSFLLFMLSLAYAVDQHL